MEELFTLVENALLLAYIEASQLWALVPSTITTGEFVILAPGSSEDNQKIDGSTIPRTTLARIAAATVRRVLSQRLRGAEDAARSGQVQGP